MKKISYCVPCYNEEKNIDEVYKQITNLKHQLADYDYEIIFEDNNSTDNTQNKIRELCKNDKHVKAIFNTRNFGPSRSGKNCCYNATGDVIISVASDLQNPVNIIPTFIKYWEEGYSVVMGQKIKSKESKIKYALRCLFYKIISSNSEIPQVENITGFGAIDSKVYKKIYEMNEPNMSIRHLLAELGYEIKLVPYTQEKRKYGKSSYNLSRNWDFAVNSLVTTSKRPIRMILNFGFIMSILVLIGTAISLVRFICQPIEKNLYLFMFFVLIEFLGIVIFCIGLIGEYIRVVFDKVTVREIITEKERLNFGDEATIKDKTY